MRVMKAGAMAMLLSVVACSDDSMPGGACTASFAMIGVTVVDGAGQPVPGASITATLVRTGQVLVPTTLMLTAPGTYVLVDDGSSSLLRRSGDAVQAHIAKGALATTADYVIALEGGCHVSRVSGPDTVTLQ
jgi:hypothetical protein